LRSLIGAALGETTWRELLATPERLDRIAEVVSFRNRYDLIRQDLLASGLDEALTRTLVTAAKDGGLDLFAGAGHVSAKAARNIIPALMQGLTYDKACARAGYDHTDSRSRHAFDVGVFGKEALARILSEKRVSRELVDSPTARKALIEALKQTKSVAPVAAMVGPFAIAVLSGSGDAAAIAFNKAMLPHAELLGMTKVALGDIAWVGSALGRGMSPVAAATAIAAGYAGVSVFDIAKRTALPAVAAAGVVVALMVLFA
jgi:hypothetical protein